MIKFKCIFEPIFAFTFSSRQRLDSFFSNCLRIEEKKKKKSGGVTVLGLADAWLDRETILIIG